MKPEIATGLHYKQHLGWRFGPETFLLDYGMHTLR